MENRSKNLATPAYGAFTVTRVSGNRHINEEIIISDSEYTVSHKSKGNVRNDIWRNESYRVW